jgi:NADH-quinone oxidoreductase subunit L
MAELFDLGKHPGNLYVLATLLPLASFLILLVAFGLRTLLSSHRDSALARNVYQLLGGDEPGKGAAYVATGAMAAAFLLSLIGFVLFASDRDLFGGGHHGAEAHHADAAGKVDESSEHGEPEDRWAAKITWLHVGYSRESNPDPATRLELGYRIDSLTAVMFLMVTLIATLIHIFSIGYMGDELQRTVEDHQVHTPGGHLTRRGRYGRFFLFLSLFCFSMLNLVLADNLFQVFLSWELVGICSYLLIGFYYERTSASNAANKAFITNRVGDAGFIIGLLILWTQVGTLSFDDLFRRIRAPVNDVQLQKQGVAGKFVRAEQVGETRDGKKKVRLDQDGSEVVVFPRGVKKLATPLGADRSITVADRPRTGQMTTMPYWMLVLAGLGIFLGCVGKSAQFPLQVWLPDAMEGPTPVSALIHAATMVAAGVYLVGRCFPLFTLEVLLTIAYTGAITLFVAATIAVVMTDIKKVLAYSTVSQLGYMMLALGVGGWIAGLFHLLTHAFFKALLFLCSGSVIYGCHHEQEMTKMGGLYPKMKVTALTMLVGVLAIAGTPLFSGWYSKDAILAHALGYASLHPEHMLLFLLPLGTAGLTVFYMFRMWFMTFTGRPRDAHVFEHAHESPRTMLVPLVVLAFFSLVVAWGTPITQAEASVLGGHEGMLAASQPAAVKADFGREQESAEDFHQTAEMLAFGIGLLGLLFAVLLYYSRVLDPEEARLQFAGVHRFLRHKWYFDELYSALLVRPALVVAGWCRWFDTKVIDGIINGLGRGTVRTSRDSGRFDLRIVDGLVNLTARVVYAVGRGLRPVQTGFLRNYVLFMALAAVALFILGFYFTGMAPGQ